jgi:hypothetical protein
MDAFATRFLFAVFLTVCTAFAQAQEDDPVTGTGVVIGYYGPAHDARAELEAAVALASKQAGHPVALFINPKKETGTAAEQAQRFATAWPDRTIVVIAILPSNEVQLAIQPVDADKARFSAVMQKRFESEINEAQVRGKLMHAVARVVMNVGAIEAGAVVEKWNPWKHPIQAVTGGQDASDQERMNAFIEFLFGLGFVGICFWWMWMFMGNPREALGALFFAALDVGASAAVSGGSGSGGGGGMSGGGGSFDGGGASGSW